MAAAGWRMFSVPFFFRIIHPYAFYRNLAYLRRSLFHASMLDALALSGTGWLGAKALQRLFCPKSAADPAVEAERVDEFSTWADLLWESCGKEYGMCAVRDAATLNLLYPRQIGKFIRLKIARRKKCIGWSVLLDTRLSGHSHFGNMRLGSLVDCFASPSDAPAVAAAARDELERRGVDLIVSNQSHYAWSNALKAAGFLTGPSNFIFSTSPPLTALLETSRIKNHVTHLTRGDGDGPINL